MDNNDSLLTQVPESNNIEPKEGLVQRSDPLFIDLDEKKLVVTLNDRVKDSKKFFDEKYHLTERRRKNETYLFGRQIQSAEEKKTLKVYESRYLDNALYEIEASIKPIALSRLPDMITIPGNDTPQSKETADDLSKVINDDLKLRDNRQVLAIAFKHLPVYFTGIIKVRWDPQIGQAGDLKFEVVHPDNVIVDHTCPTNNADDMGIICQYLPLTVQEIIMRFPDKKEGLFEALREDGLVVGQDEPTTKDLASVVKISEVWFTWYKEPKKKEEELPNEEKKEWERLEGVMWKYKDVVLKVMKNPNFDYEGEEKLFTYDDPSDESTKRELKPEEMMQSMMTGIVPPNMATEQIYKNYFDNPRKPYFFMGYDQWHKIPYDETSRIEQNIRNQESLDRQGKQIIETLSSRIKHIFSKESALKADDIEKLDLDDPTQDILVDGDVNKVHGVIVPERPDQAQFASLDSTRDRMYAIAGSFATRGQMQSDVATTNQIAREADFTRADDLVEETINAASEWMSEWTMQLIKLRYTKDHMRKVLGSKADFTFIKLNRDMIEDGMEVRIKSSGTDKLKAQKNALDLAKLQMTDPLSLFTDLDVSDPKGRAEKLMMFQTNPAQYMAQFIEDLGNNPNELAQTLEQGIPGAEMAAGVPPDPMVPDMGMPAQPTPTDTAAVPATPPVGIPAASPRVI